MKVRVYLGLFALLFLFSCETVRQFTVETLTPASVVYPVSPPRVVIVNNAVVQPADNGVEFHMGDVQLRNWELNKDTATGRFIEYLADELHKTAHFEEILIYNHPIRTDNSFLAALPIQQDSAQKIAKEVNADALLVLDKLLFNLSQRVIGKDAYYCSSKVKCEGTFSVYLPDKNKVTQTFVLEDTLKFNSYVGHDTTLILRAIPEHLLLVSAMRMAETATKKFAPYWQFSERLFYTGPDSQLKTAFAYANKNRWPQAIEMWTRIYNSESNNKHRGKAAINIAVAEELNNSYTSAISWVDKALEVYGKEKAKNVRNELQFATDYKKELVRLRSLLLN